MFCNFLVLSKSILKKKDIVMTTVLSQQSKIKDLQRNEMINLKKWGAVLVRFFSVWTLIKHQEKNRRN